jgi:hypothetical protein
MKKNKVMFYGVVAVICIIVIIILQSLVSRSERSPALQAPAPVPAVVPAPIIREHKDTTVQIEAEPAMEYDVQQAHENGKVLF